MTAPVTWQEHHLEAVELTEQGLIRRLAERRCERAPLGVSEPLEIVDAAPSQDAENRLINVLAHPVLRPPPGCIALSTVILQGSRADER